MVVSVIVGVVKNKVPTPITEVVVEDDPAVEEEQQQQHQEETGRHHRQVQVLLRSGTIRVSCQVCLT